MKRQSENEALTLRNEIMKQQIVLKMLKVGGYWAQKNKAHILDPEHQTKRSAFWKWHGIKERNQSLLYEKPDMRTTKIT